MKYGFSLFLVFAVALFTSQSVSAQGLLPGGGSGISSYVDFSSWNYHVNNLGLSSIYDDTGDLLESKTNVRLENTTDAPVFYTITKSQSHNGTVYASSTFTIPMAPNSYVIENCVMTNANPQASSYIFKVKVLIKDATGTVIAEGSDVHSYTGVDVTEPESIGP